MRVRIDWAARPLEELIGELTAAAGIEKVVHVPPNLYLRLTGDFIRRAVATHVRARRLDYASSGDGRGLFVDVNFSDPNANKPLHVGHLRNNFLGMAVAKLLAAAGYNVRRSEFVSDWGIHICQAAVAHARWERGTSPADAGMRGDRFVGALYARFHSENARLRDGGGREPTELEHEASTLLRRMEARDEDAMSAVLRLAGWAEDGIRETYERIGTRMDAVIRESEALDLGREMVADALERGLCRRRPDGSVYVDLSDLGMDELTFLRRDGTQTVYTRGCAVLVKRACDTSFDRVIDLLGSHWRPRYTAALEALKIFGYDEIARIEPLFFGMVQTPDGPISSREGTELLADDVIDWLRGELEARLDGDRAAAENVALAVLKYHFLSIRAEKRITFDKREILERTAPRFARVMRTLRQLADPPRVSSAEAEGVADLALHLATFPGVVSSCAQRLDPARICTFIDTTCLLVSKSSRRGRLDDAERGAAEITLRRALALLNIDLADEACDLPGPRSKPDSAGARPSLVGGRAV